MSIIANAPLWFHLGVGIGVLLLSALSLVATKQLNRPDVGIQLSYVAMIIGGGMLVIIGREIARH